MHSLLYFLFPLCMVSAALFDLRSLIIPDWIPVALVLLFAGLAPVAGVGWASASWHALGALTVFVPAFFLFALGALGGGDAKLVSATALWMGSGAVLLHYVVSFAVAGGVLALLVLLFRRVRLAASCGKNPWLRHLADSGCGIPYGIALAIGGVAAYPSSEMAQLLWSLGSSGGLSN